MRSIGPHLHNSQSKLPDQPASQLMTSATTPTETHVAEPESQKNTYSQILKSSVLIGGSQAANIGIGIIRTKAMALLLGPAGYGLFGIFGTIANMAQSIAGMG